MPEAGPGGGGQQQQQGEDRQAVLILYYGQNVVARIRLKKKEPIEVDIS